MSPQRGEQLLAGEVEEGSKLLDSGLGLFESGTLDPEPELVRIEGGRFLAVWHTHIPDLYGFSERVGPFEISLDDGLTLTADRPRPASGASWIVNLETDRITVGEVRPTPTALYRDGRETRLEWYFPVGKGERLEASLDPPEAVTIVAETDRGGLNALRMAAFVILATLFLPALLLLFKRNDLGAGAAPGWRLRFQVHALTAAIGLTLLGLLANFLKDQAIEDPHYFQWDEALRLAIWLTPDIIFVAVAAAVFIAGRPLAPRSMAAALALCAVTGLGVAVGFSEIGPVTLVDHHSLRMPGFLAGTLGIGIVVYLLVDGLLRTLVIGLRDANGEIPGSAARKGEIAALAFTLVLLGAAAAAYTKTSFNLIDEIGSLASVAIANAIFTTLPLLPLVILPGAARVLTDSPGGSPFLVRARGLWLLALVLYLFFVVTQVGSFVGFTSPGSLLIGGLVLAGIGGWRIARLDGLDLRLAATAGAGADSPLISHRRELIDRALLIERMQRLRKTAHQKHTKSEEGGEGFLAYRRRLDELDTAERYLQTGEGSQAAGVDQEQVSLSLPEKPPVIYLALGLGPGKDWRENGSVAFRYGARLAILPIAYVLYVLVKREFGSVFDPVYGFELFPLITLLGSEIALWLIVSYVFGCLFTWLPWGNGALKGLLFSLPVVGGMGLLELCPLYAGPSDWIFRCVEVLAFLSVLGVLIDLCTVRGAGLRERDLAELYQLRSVRFGVVNLAPLLLAAFGIYQQIRAGNPQGAVEHALESAQQQFPGGGE